MAFAQDVLTRIVKVQWGGAATFVAAGRDGGGRGSPLNVDYPALLFYSEVEQSEPPYPAWSETEVLFDVPLGPHGGHILCAFRASAYGKPRSAIAPNGTPTFVVGGSGTDFLTAGSNAYIQTSNDGLAWSTTFSHPRFAYVYAMTWDENKQAFYAAMIHAPDSGGTREVLLMSPNGTNWVSDGEQDIVGGATYTSLLEPHCSTRVKNTYDEPLPSGLYGYDAEANVLIIPYPTPQWHVTSDGSHDTDGPGPDIQIHTFDEDGNKHITLKTLTGFAIVNAIGQAEGIWQAVGRTPGENATGIIATSTDSGQTWATSHIAATNFHFIDVISGAPRTDFGA